MVKALVIKAEQMKELLSLPGGCIITDRVTVDGEPVRYMYRSESADPYDSGWAFFAGDETDVYLSDADNCGIYELNTIANYSPDIIPYLEISAPCAPTFEV